VSDREYVETWKGIADRIGRSARWARYMAKRADHPLPVGYIGGLVRMYMDDFERWCGTELAIEGKSTNHHTGASRRPSPRQAATGRGPKPRGRRGLIAICIDEDIYRRVTALAKEHNRYRRDVASELLRSALDASAAGGAA